MTIIYKKKTRLRNSFIFSYIRYTNFTLGNGKWVNIEEPDSFCNLQRLQVEYYRIRFLLLLYTGYFLYKRVYIYIFTTHAHTHIPQSAVTMASTCNGNLIVKT